jgi:primosomal protein N'
MYVMVYNPAAQMCKRSCRLQKAHLLQLVHTVKAAKNESLTEEYNRIPKSVVTREAEEESVRKWQRHWTQSTKGSTAKEYFPNIEGRLKMKLNLTQNFMAIVTGHGKTKAYLHRFKIIRGSNMHLRKSSTDNRPPDL